MKKIIEIRGMKCTGCENAIESALGKIEGVENVSADYRKGRAIVEYDENRVSLQKIVEKINNLGYEAEM